VREIESDIEGQRLRRDRGAYLWVLGLTALVIIVITIPLGFYFYKFHNGLSPSSSDWANFGSYLSGTLGSILSAASVIALIFTLHKTSRDSRITQSLTLKALEKSERQIALMEQEFKVGLLMGYVNTLNQQLAEFEYKLKDTVIGHDSFLDEAYHRLSSHIWSRQMNNIVGSKRGFDFYLPGQILHDLQVSFTKEARVYWYVLDLIDKSIGDLKVVLKKSLLAHVSHDLLFWLSGYVFLENRDLMTKDNYQLFVMSHRAADSIVLGEKMAREKLGPPQRGER
jgi:uncharacterized membrane protein